MALKESIKQIGRFIGVLQPQQPYYDQYGNPVHDGAFSGNQYGHGYGQQQGFGSQQPYYREDDFQPQQYAQQYPQQHQPQFSQQYPQQHAQQHPQQYSQQQYSQQQHPQHPPQQHMQPPPQAAPAQFGQQQPFVPFGGSPQAKQPPSNVLPMPGYGGDTQRANKVSEIITENVRTLEDCKGIINALLEHKSVFINLETADDVLSQRVIDILSGATCALEGTITKISHRAYLVAPETVDVINSRPPATGAAFRGEFSARR